MHNVCLGGCGGSSEEPGVCTTEGCEHKGRELKQCDCTDDKHGVDESDESKEMSGEEKSE